MNSTDINNNIKFEKEKEDYSDSDDDFIPPPPPENEDDSDVDDDDVSITSSLAEENIYNDKDDTPYNFDNNLNTQQIIDSDIDINDDDDDDDDDDDENYLQKFDDSIQQQIISNYHPEMKTHNYDEVNKLSKVVRNENGIIVDPLHKSVPFITRYEKAKIIGERSKQLSAGSQPLVEVDNNVIDEYLIATKEFNEKKIPFIIKRPMPNGGCEYWKFEDLEILL